MKVLMINVVCGIRSTGRICTDIANELSKQGHEVKIAYGREPVPKQFQAISHCIGNDFDVKKHGLLARIMDKSGFGSKNVTKRFVKWIEKYDPDVIHLHNLHGYYIHVGVLFDYLKRSGKKVIWTLHDCWPFTGHCSYFDYIGCNKWQDGCFKCPLKNDYPKSILCDQSKHNYEKKKEIFSGLTNMEIVTPSHWLAKVIEDSFLKEYKVEVIHNGVDVNTFKLTEIIHKNIKIPEKKKIILGVAAIWNKRKGLDDFLKLSQMLDDTYQIVLVGLSEAQIDKLPPNVIGIKRTNDVYELASLYSRASVYVNPTYEDNYPTTNIEAIACGTPVVSYATGGSSESAKLHGSVVDKGDVNALFREIVRWTNDEKGLFTDSQNVSLDTMIQKYLQLYEERMEEEHPKKD